MSTEYHWDAGEMGCGELIIRLKLMMRDELVDGDVLQLIAHDPGAREDLPAWCRLTGNALLEADHPRYVIRRGSRADDSAR